MKKFFIVLSGPTGVGKSDLALSLAQQLPIEVINADVGSLYEPLTIGTAKPDLTQTSVPHHLFNVLQEPRNFSVKEYRSSVMSVMEKIWNHNKIPVVVGGSLFYLQALFFPPQEQKAQGLSDSQKQDLETYSTLQLWDLLNSIDTERALELYPEDRYRIVRALTLWYTTHKKPSELEPVYKPIADCYWIFTSRDRRDLYQRINDRVITMIDAGWLEEVQQLSSAWHDFLMIKRLIGYPEIIDYLKKPHNNFDREREQLIAAIQQKTRNYAKRQITFWRMLRKKLLQESMPDTLIIDEPNLTLLSLTLYIDQLLQKITLFTR